MARPRCPLSQATPLTPRILKPKYGATAASALALAYDNHAYDINTGITNAVKSVEVLDRSGHVAARGVLQMPHIRPVGSAHPDRLSTALRVRLDAGDYSARIADFFNMSDLEANAGYGGPGGTQGPRNTAELKALLITRIP